VLYHLCPSESVQACLVLYLIRLSQIYLELFWNRQDMGRVALEVRKVGDSRKYLRRRDMGEGSRSLRHQVEAER